MDDPRELTAIACAALAESVAVLVLPHPAAPAVLLDLVHDGGGIHTAAWYFSAWQRIVDVGDARAGTRPARPSPRDGKSSPAALAASRKPRSRGRLAHLSGQRVRVNARQKPRECVGERHADVIAAVASGHGARIHVRRLHEQVVALFAPE